MVTITTMLVSVAEFSNIVAVFAVLLCFCGMILFITRNMMVLRVHGDDLVFTGPLHQVPHRIPQMNMMKVHIPFTFKLVETSKSSYAGVQCSISSQVQYCIKAYWGVSIRELHLCLWKPWSVLKEICHSDNLLKEHIEQIGVSEIKDVHDRDVVTLSLPAPPLTLGTPPRLRYPLVIFLIRTDRRDEDIHPDEAVAVINVVHIKDSVCTLHTSILAQYLKQANGQLSCLKQLYLATGNACGGGGYDDGQIPLSVAEPVEADDDDAADDPLAAHTLVCPTTDESTVWNSAGEQLCVVCQYFPISRALLPCRHTCVCASCFDKLERCPMCRGPIKSYFCIRGEEYMPLHTSNKNSGSTNSSGNAHSVLYNWLDSWNDRLIDFLGFQR